MNFEKLCVCVRFRDMKCFFQCKQMAKQYVYEENEEKLYTTRKSASLPGNQMNRPCVTPYKHRVCLYSPHMAPFTVLWPRKHQTINFASCATTTCNVGTVRCLCTRYAIFAPISCDILNDTCDLGNDKFDILQLLVAIIGRIISKISNSSGKTIGLML